MALKLDFYKDKKILITGGLGFIGSNLAHRLVALGAELLLVDSLIPEYGGNLFNISDIIDKVKINIADVRDQYSMNYLIRNQDIIFNLAGTLSHMDSLTDPYTDLEVNCRSQLSLLESCRKYNPGVKVIFAGTRSQYGRPQHIPVDERHPMIPVDVNGINNIAGEQYHLLYYKLYGIRTTSLRLANTYGPRHQMKHSRQGIINWFIRLVMDDQEVQIFGDGKQIRDANYVDDVVEAFLLAGLSDKVHGDVFNLGGTPESLLNIVKLLIEITGSGRYRLCPFPEERRTIEVGDYIADISKIKTTLDWKHKVSLKEGLEKTVEYYAKYRNYYWE